MNKTTAIIVTVVTALICGCPGLVLAGLGVLAAFGSQVPEVMAQNTGTPQEALLGAGMFICVGGILLLVPIIAGILSFRFAKAEEPAINEIIPPAA